MKAEWIVLGYPEKPASVAQLYYSVSSATRSNIIFLRYFALAAGQLVDKSEQVDAEVQLAILSMHKIPLPAAT